MAPTSKDLLELEQKKSSSLESKLLVCRKGSSTQTKRPQTSEKPVTTSVPTSQVLGKVKDFLGVMAEANKKLQSDTLNSHKDYDIEVLSGNETEYIEMDLMLGVADLQTPEAVAAAESAVAGSQPAFPLAGRDSESDSEDNSDEPSEDDDNTCYSKKFEKPKLDGDDSLRKSRPKKRSKIIELC